MVIDVRPRQITKCALKPLDLDVRLPYSVVAEFSRMTIIIHKAAHRHA